MNRPEKETAKICESHEPDDKEARSPAQDPEKKKQSMQEDSVNQIIPIKIMRKQITDQEMKTLNQQINVFG